MERLRRDSHSRISDDTPSHNGVPGSFRYDTLSPIAPIEFSRDIRDLLWSPQDGDLL